MQLSASLFTEAINMVLICTQSDVLSTISNFVALKAIAEIDNYYYDSLVAVEYKCILEEIKLCFEKDE